MAALRVSGQLYDYDYCVQQIASLIGCRMLAIIGPSLAGLAFSTSVTWSVFVPEYSAPL